MGRKIYIKGFEIIKIILLIAILFGLAEVVVHLKHLRAEICCETAKGAHE